MERHIQNSLAYITDTSTMVGFYFTWSQYVPFTLEAYHGSSVLFRYTLTPSLVYIKLGNKTARNKLQSEC